MHSKELPETDALRRARTLILESIDDPSRDLVDELRTLMTPGATNPATTVLERSEVFDLLRELQKDALGVAG